MDDDQDLRRRLILASVAAGLMPVVASAQKGKSPESDFGDLGNSQKAGSLHYNGVEQLKKILGDDSPSSATGLHKLIAALPQGVVTEDNKKVLDKLVNAIFFAKSTDELYKAVDTIVSGVKQSSDDVMTAILQIAKSSLYQARKALNDRNTQRIVHIVSKDLSGALCGPLLAVLASSASAPPILVALLIFGALATSVATSLDAYYSDGKANGST